MLAGCAAAPAQGPLEGRIWDARAERFVDEETLLEALRRARFRLLGETHDHPGHHALRARLLTRLGSPTEVYFEQVDRERDGAVREAQRAGGDADALARAGGLDGKLWRWPLHRPLFAAALAAGLPVRAANLSRTEARRVVSSGAVPPGLAETLARADWSEGRENALRLEIVESHCGELPAGLAPGMALAQRARDAAMALALDGAAGSAVLIAGNGHVRLDQGVPLYLPKGAALLSVGFLETRQGEADPRAYARGRNGEHSYDYVWFTSPQPRPDPCEALRKR